MSFFLIGEKLGHSYSKIIHDAIGFYNYDLLEINKENLANFFDEKNFSGLNITIPYKKEAISFMKDVNNISKDIYAINTCININDKLYGFNTDYYGLKFLIEKLNISLENKNILILGTGGTSNTAYVLCKNLKAKNILKASREQRVDNNIITYDEIPNFEKEKFCFDIIINTTPSGMYPNVDNSPVSIKSFQNIEAVVDVIYNPTRTKLCIDAKLNKIKNISGMYMIITQAVIASFYFNYELYCNGQLSSCNREIKEFLNKIYSTIDIDDLLNDTEKFDLALNLYLQKFNYLIEEIYSKIIEEKENIILIGMPGVGKTTYGRKIAEELNKEFFDTDVLIKEESNKTPNEIILENGEEYFRNIETEIIKQLKLKNNIIIATGGGAILKTENIYSLGLYGKFLYLKRPIEEIASTNNRPLSNTKEKLYSLYNNRKDIYELVADKIIELDKQ